MKKTLLLLAAIAPATAVAQIASTDSIATHELDKVLVYSTRTAVPLKQVPGKIEVIRPEAQLLHPAALVWSASAHYDVTKQLHVGANFRNIFSEYYTEKDGYHMPGRLIQFSASYRF